MKKISAIILFLINCIISVLLIYKQLYTFSIVAITINTILLVYLIKCLLEQKNPKSIYDNELKEIVKTFEPILVDVEKIPDLQVKNLIIVSSFEKMIDIQYELKKPILYKNSLNSCAFFLLDTDIVYVFVLRVNEDSFSPVDDVIASIEMDNKKRRKDKKILDDIDKTTIIKLDDFREFKVSPVRKKDLTIIEETNIEYDEAKEELKTLVVENIVEETPVVEEPTTVVEETITEEETIDVEEQPEEEATIVEENEIEEETPVVEGKEEESTEEKTITKEQKKNKKNHATERARKYRQKQKKVK